mgnify:FL=1
MKEEQKETIQKEAKEILRRFAASLEKVSSKKKPLKEEFGGFREEGSGESANQEFRKQMLKNAPEKDNDFIIAEKKKW